MEKKKRSSKATALLIIIVLLIIGNTALTSFNDHTITATVIKKDIVTRHSKKTNKTVYYIYCVDEAGKESRLKNSNMLIRGKMNSFEIYQALEVGKTYELTVVGFKIPVIAPYENILKYKEIK